MENDIDIQDEIATGALDLGLSSDPFDLDVLRREIKIRISELHPDHQNLDSGDRLRRLIALMKKLGDETNQLQIADGGRALSTVLGNSLAARTAVEGRIKDLKVAQVDQLQRSFRGTKISLGVVTAALTTAFAFPRTFMEHPFIGPLLKGAWASRIWFGCVSSLAIAWVLVWLVEKGKRARLASLSSLRHQQSVLASVGSKDDKTFSRAQFEGRFCRREIWYPKWSRKIAASLFKVSLYYFKDPLYDDEMIEDAAQLALDRFLSKGWIVSIPRPADEDDADDWYRIT